ncbi:MAG: TatD family hydrolase [Acidimicrobiales bacterium]
MRWTDDHCHLGDGSDRWPEAEATIAEARAAGVMRMITVGCDLESSKLARDVAAAHDGVWATAGVHPHDASGGIDGIVALLSDPNVVAVGECGLDYHYEHSPRDVQKIVFAAQIALAHEHDLALVVHTREAWDDTFAMFASEGMPPRTVIHCFTGGPEEAERCLELGAWLSFSGIVTFPGAPEVLEAARICPLDRLLVETDSPFLAPVPHRGKPNRPALLPVVGTAIADAKGISVADVADVTWKNTEFVYRLSEQGIREVQAVSST